LGLTATKKGLVPTGMVAMTVLVAVLITETVGSAAVGSERYRGRTKSDLDTGAGERIGCGVDDQNVTRAASAV
jgi:hypothetical protein